MLLSESLSASTNHGLALKEEAGVGEGEAWGRRVQLMARHVPLLEQVASQEPLLCTHRLTHNGERIEVGSQGPSAV